MTWIILMTATANTMVAAVALSIASKLVRDTPARLEPLHGSLVLMGVSVVLVWVSSIVHAYLAVRRRSPEQRQIAYNVGTIAMPALIGLSTGLFAIYSTAV